MKGWIVLRVLNQQLKFQSEIDLLVSEVCLLQQFEEVEDKTVKGIEVNGVLQPDCFIQGNPRFTAVSLRSGLQFRVEETRDAIKCELALAKE